MNDILVNYLNHSGRGNTPTQNDKLKQIVWLAANIDNLNDADMLVIDQLSIKGYNDSIKIKSTTNNNSIY